jgi:hypothetical protein
MVAIDRDDAQSGKCGWIWKQKKTRSLPAAERRYAMVRWANRRTSRLRKGGVMADPARLAGLDQRIAAVRENIRVLTEQAAAYSGAADEARNADRIAEQDALLARLLKEREALSGKA